MESLMASLYFMQYRSKSGLSTAGLHVYRSHYDSANKQVVKTRLGVIPMTGAELPPTLVGKLSADELRQVVTKAKAVAMAMALRLRARADQIERGLEP